jgi:hypothetical protein
MKALSLAGLLSRGLACAALAVPAFAACGPAVAPAPAAAPSVEVVVPPAPPTAKPVADDSSAACVERGPRPAVLDLEKDWPAQDWLRGPRDESPAVLKACKKLAERRERARKKIPDAELGVVGVCEPSPRGAWALDVEEAKQLEPDPESGDPGGWEARYALVYVLPDGRVARSPDVADVVSSHQAEERGVSVIGTFDYDGDGASEIIVLQSSDYGGEEHYENTRVLTFKNNLVLPYVPAEGLDISRVVDVDADGRPDLVIPSPVSVSGPCGLDGQTFGGPSHVAHSRPDGTFSLDDAVAKEVVRKQCGPISHSVLAITRDKEEGTSIDNALTARRIACSRIYGERPEDLVRHIRERYPYPHKSDDSEADESSNAGYCMPLKLMVDLATQAPVFKTWAPCPAR